MTLELFHMKSGILTCEVVAAVAVIALTTAHLQQRDTRIADTGIQPQTQFCPFDDRGRNSTAELSPTDDQPPKLYLNYDTECQF